MKNRNDTTPAALGMLAKHYAPKTKTYLVNDVEKFIKPFENKRIGILRIKDEMNAYNIEHLEILSKSGDLK